MTLPALVVRALSAARDAEKDQTRFYRALAGLAEDAGDAETSERLNGLLADEQHHYSRLTVRLMELGVTAADAPAANENVILDGWEAEARTREEAEVARYTALLAMELDERTHALVEEILAVERRHAETLGGKWMVA